MKNLLSLFIISLFFFWFFFSAHASEQLPKNIGAFNKYLSSVNTNERVAIYSEIINNIDTLIKEVNTSTTISKLQKRKLLAQYRLYKSRTQLALKREQKNTIVNIDFQRIIPNKTTNSNTTTSINTGNTNSTVTYQQPSQPYQQNTTTNTNISTPISTTNTSIQTVNPTTINTTSQTQNTIPSTPTYNEKILIWNSNIISPEYRRIDAEWLVEIGRFSILASNEDFVINKMKFTNNGTSNLLDLFSWNPDIELIDIERWAIWNIDCWSLYSDNTLEIENCNLSPILKWTKRNFKVMIKADKITNSTNKTIQLNLSPSDISLIRLSDSGSIDTQKINGSVNFDTFTINYAPPSVIIDRTQIKISNFSSANAIEITDIWFELSHINENLQVKWVYCLIVIWSNNRCEWINASQVIEINKTWPISYNKFTLPTLSYYNIINKNETLSIWYYVDVIYANKNLKATIKSISYKVDWVIYEYSQYSHTSIEL